VPDGSAPPRSTQPLIFGLMIAARNDSLPLFISSPRGDCALTHPLLTRFRKARRRRVKRIGKRLRRALGPFLGRHSTVGDPAVFPPGLFPFEEGLHQNWETIRDEALRVMSEPDRLPRLNEISPDNRRIAKEGTWRIFFFYGFGERLDRSCDLCPVTAAQLDAIPGIQNAWFSILEPDTRVPLHHGITKGLVRVHLPLVVPEDHEACFIELDGHRHAWREGELFVFDDTLPHLVENNTTETRIILLIDFERPLDRQGRLASRAFLAAMRRSAYVQDAARNLRRWEEDYFGRRGDSP
jgi:ornithine lipid ester-linked acyl 2-hydroxylase